MQILIDKPLIETHLILIIKLRNLTFKTLNSHLLSL
jgi:hypothetical protein